MRRIDRKLDEAQTMELLQRGEYGVLCLIDPEGSPYGVPLNYAVVNGNIYVHAALEGKKLQCVAYCPDVCFTVVGLTEVLPDKFSTRYESVIVTGSAAVIEPSEEKDEALLALIRKYSNNFMEKGMAYINSDKNKTVVIRIIPSAITGKKRA